MVQFGNTYFTTVKLGIKELLNKEQIGFKELFTDYQPFYLYNNLSISVSQSVCLSVCYLLPQFWFDLNFKGTYGFLGPRRR